MMMMLETEMDVALEVTVRSCTFMLCGKVAELRNLVAHLV